MELPKVAVGNGTAVRHRKAGVAEMVQGFDAFNKVADDVKEEPKAAKGFLSVICFTLIFVLLVGQLYEYYTNTDVEYRFPVDTAYDEKPILDLDMIVSTPCNNLAIMPMGFTDPESNSNEGHFKKNPSRFELTPEEAELWATLQKVHKDHFKPGTPLKALNEMTFMQGDVEQGLRTAADEKQKLEIRELQRQRKEAKEKGEDSPESGFMLMVGNGFGMFQIISSGGDSEKDEGTACRITGRVPVQKGSTERVTISVGKSMNIGNIVAHIAGNHHGNISHRIERFHFGPHVWGLVSPLAGNEQIADKPGTTYRYFIKVVPTRIYKSGLFRRPVLTYQYAVTYVKKEAKEGEHSHDTITFDYEFTATVIEIRPASLSSVQFLLRICSLIGGIFATSSFIETYASKFNILSHFRK